MFVRTSLCAPALPVLWSSPSDASPPERHFSFSHLTLVHASRGIMRFDVRTHPRVRAYTLQKEPSPHYKCTQTHLLHEAQEVP